jgi:hypothetical protein
MKAYFLISFLLITFTLNKLPAQDRFEDRLQPYIKVLETEGEEPIDFVINKLKEVDLIIFDDALHTAVKPFEFYQELIKTPSFYKKVKKVFIEATSVNKQQHIDAYFESEPENRELLYPAFQDDINGTGWPLKTYFDLFHTIYVLNRSLPEEQRLEVIGVDNPTYWSEIKTKRDLELFRKTLRSRDFSMYKMIVTELNNFEDGEKGIFLTNTRHAYKGIKNSKNKFYWNTGTFFHQWHPGKTYSIHFHNVYLFFEKNEKPAMKFDRIADGIWDSAFKALGNKPTAISLKNNVFGNEKYIGNHMLNVAPNQMMYDAYDALIFLGPLENMRRTALVDFIYTDKYKIELQRRYKILYSEEEIKQMTEDYGVDNLKELIDKVFVAEPEILLPQAQSIQPIDAWKTKDD